MKVKIVQHIYDDTCRFLFGVEFSSGYQHKSIYIYFGKKRIDIEWSTIKYIKLARRFYRLSITDQLKYIEDATKNNKNLQVGKQLYRWVEDNLLEINKILGE